MNDSLQSRPVWMIIPTFYPVIGGTQSQVRRLAQRLIAYGQPVHVLTSQHSQFHPDGLPPEDVIDGIPVRRVYSRGVGKFGSLLYMLGGWWYLMRHSRRGIYHANAVGAAGWLAVAARYLLGGRCLVKMRLGCHGYEENYASGIARWQLVTLLRLADRVQVVSSELERMVGNMGVQVDRVVRIPNAVDTAVYCPASVEEKTAMRTRLGLPLHNTILLWVGRLDPIKGLDVLLRAWALLKQHMRETALLVLVGDGPERDKLLALMKRLGVAETVRMVGAQGSVREYYWAADIFVLPSRSEGLSGALVEAMACGLPVIASNVGGALDVIQEGKNGTLFGLEDCKQLAQELATMIAMPVRWAEMGAQARETVKAYAELDVVVQQLHDLYRQLD